MESPLNLINKWLEEERELGNIFPQGAVLSTISKNGKPRSRVVGTMLDKQNVPKFFTSPSSRKIQDITFSTSASLTYSFQSSVRSISIEGEISELSDEELDQDWPKHDEGFRKHYVVFGATSGETVTSLETLRSKRDGLNTVEYEVRPASFVGYKFSTINRISFYSVKDGDFAVNRVFDWDRKNGGWSNSLLVP